MKLSGVTMIAILDDSAQFLYCQEKLLKGMGGFHNLNLYNFAPVPATYSFQWFLGNSTQVWPRGGIQEGWEEGGGGEIFHNHEFKKDCSSTCTLFFSMIPVPAFH